MSQTKRYLYALEEARTRAFESSSFRKQQLQIVTRHMLQMCLPVVHKDIDRVLKTASKDTYPSTPLNEYKWV